MTDRPKISLPKAKPAARSDERRRPPVRGAGSAPRHRPSAAEAEQARQRQAEQAEQARQSPAEPPRKQHADPARPPRTERKRDDPRGPRADAGPPPRGPGAPQKKRPAAARPAAPRAASPAEATRAALAALAGEPAPARDRTRPTTRPAARPAARPTAAPPVTPSPEAAPPQPREEDDGRMRLSKRMGELGLASRREADEWIARGWVRVDGEVIAELGSRVRPDQTITVDPAAHAMQARQVTILLNKPVGYVSGQAEDGHEPAIVLVTPDNHWRGDPTGIKFKREHLRSLAPAGRLDIDSVGLLVLTQDGRVAKRLIGEDSEIDKEYLVRVEYTEAPRPGPLPEVFPQALLDKLNHGLELDGKPLKPAQVRWQNDNQLRFVLREGRKRQIRRMCEAVGLKVVGLKRIRIGRVMLGDLPAGQWRYLRGDESF